MATIQGVYIALFGRPADPTGLAYFSGVTNNGADLSKIGNLSGQKEYTDRFSGQSNSQIINSIYQSLFGRDAESAGLEFFSNALNKGSLNINNIAIAILDGAQGTDKTIVTNKVAAADLYTSHLDTATEQAAYTGNSAAASGRAFISTVSTTAATAAQVDAAIITLQSVVAAGNTITPVAAIATLDGVTGAGSPLVVTTNNNDTINANAAAALWAPSTSKIDGQLGTDTLNALLNTIVGANGVVVADGLKNVEIVNISTTGGASVLDFTNAKQLTQLTHVANAGLAASNQDLTSTVAQTVTYGLKGALGAAADTVTFTDADTSSNLKLAFNGATTTSALIVSNAGTISIANTGTSGVTVQSDTKTIAVTGDGALTLGLTDAVVEKVDASAFTGKLDYTANATIKSILGGSGNDTIKIAATHTADATVTGGAGADILTITAGAATKMTTLTGGAGADQFVIASGVSNIATDTAANLAKSMIHITDFTASEDAIKVSVAAPPATIRDTLLTAELADISSQSDLLAAVTKAASYTDINHASVFTFGGDSYIFVQDGATALAATDALIHVTGVSDISTFTASNFQLS